MSRLHPGALADHLRTAVPRSTEQPPWGDSDGRLPTLFFGHGAPPLLDDPQWMEQLFGWAVSRPKPRAILIVSAHWENAPLALSAPRAGVPLVYDFGGFDQRFYELTYPTPDASGLADRVARQMPGTAPVHLSSARGLDHGAWVPLMVMYPLGDVPVLQLSLPTHDPATLLKVGGRLRSLPDEGILVLGSGFLTHGLPFLSRSHWMEPDTPPRPAGRPTSTCGRTKPWPPVTWTPWPTTGGPRECPTPTRPPSTSARSSSPWAWPGTTTRPGR